MRLSSSGQRVPTHATAARTAAAGQAPANATTAATPAATHTTPDATVPTANRPSRAPRPTALQAALMSQYQAQRKARGQSQQPAASGGSVSSPAAEAGQKIAATRAPVQATFPLDPREFQRAETFSEAANGVVNDTLLAFRQNLLSLNGAIPDYTSRVTCNYRSELLAEWMQTAIHQSGLDNDITVAGHLNFRGRGEASEQNAWEYHVAPLLKNNLAKAGDKNSVLIADPLTGVHSVEEWLTMHDAKTDDSTRPGEAKKYIAKALPRNASPDDIGSTGAYKTQNIGAFEADAAQLVPAEKQRQHEINLAIAATRSVMWKLFGNIGGNADDFLSKAQDIPSLASTVDMLIGFRADQGQKHDAQDVFEMVNQSFSQMLPAIAERVHFPLAKENELPQEQASTPDSDTNLFDLSQFDLSWMKGAGASDDDSSLDDELLEVASFEAPADLNIDTSWMLKPAGIAQTHRDDASQHSTEFGSKSLKGHTSSSSSNG